MPTVRPILVRCQAFLAANRATICVLLAVLTLCRYWVGYDATVLVPHCCEDFALARNIAFEGQFANPFRAVLTGPSAHLAPLFPAFLAFIIRVFGTGAAGAYAYQIAAVLAVCILVSLLPLASQRLGAGFGSGILASLLWLIAKPPLYPAWECTYGAVLVLIGTCLFRQFFRVNQHSTRSFKILAGIAVGLLGCWLPTSLPAIFVWFLWLTWTLGAHKFPRHYLVLLLLPALTILPWVARNYLVFHRFVPIRDNFGLELSVSNNDCATYSFPVNEKSGCFKLHHPNENPELAREMKSEGEAAYNGVQLHRAFQWIRNHQSQFWHLSRQRAVAFWLPNESGSPLHDITAPGRRMLRLIEYGMTFLSLVGLCLLLRQDRTSGVLCGLWLALFPVTYYFVQFDERYRLPIMWVTFLLGALPLTRAVEALAAIWNSEPVMEEDERRLKRAA